MMPARAIWKGVLKIGSEKVPVKLYSAVEDRGVHFHILEAKTQKPVKQRMVDPDTEEEISNRQIQHGVELEPGTFVILKDEDLKKLEPEPSRDITVSRFVPAERIDPQWFERPYYLGPDADDSTFYFSLAKAMSNKSVEGVASWVMRNKRYTGALRVRDSYLMLVTLRHAEELLSAKDLPAPAGRPLDDREIKMARQLVAALEAPFQPQDFHDEYRERVTQFIEAKAHGRRPKLAVVKHKQGTTGLMTALSASLKKMKAVGGKAVA